jgi:hypothetical protein
MVSAKSTFGEKDFTAAGYEAVTLYFLSDLSVYFLWFAAYLLA